MASNETAFRTELCEAARKKGYHAVVLSQKWVSGTVDVYISGPVWAGWIELKYMEMPKMGETKIKVNMSKLQREFIKKENQYGRAGWIVCVKDGREWKYYCGRDSEVETVDQREYNYVRRHGEETDVESLLLALAKSK